MATAETKQKRENIKSYRRKTRKNFRIKSLRMSAHDRKIRSPVIASKDNPATDPRQMRRIIAEDPNWSLATVPLLTELCIKHIVHNFEDHPILDGLLPKHKSKVLEALSTGISMKVTSSLVSDEGYWKKCCKSRWEVCDVAKHGDSWKRMYFERNLEGIIESFVPETTDPMPLYETLKLSAAYIKALNIRQLLPPVKEAPLKDDDASDAGSDAGQDGPNIDHFDFGVIIPKLPFLEEIHITYGVRDCGMNFEWNLFQFTSRDCLLLAKAVKACNSLKVFHLHRSQVDDEKVRVLISHLLDHPSLLTLDLSHNKIGDSGARAIGKLINGRCKLTTLNLCDNKIRSNGAAAIGHALGKNQTLNEINLRMNRLGDDGGQAICKALLKNNYLTKVHIGSNDLGEPTAAVIAQVLVSNKILVDLNLSCNKIGPDGGKSLQEGMEENTTIRTMDLRLTEVGQESEYCINQLLKRNRENQYKQNAISDH